MSCIVTQFAGDRRLWNLALTWFAYETIRLNLINPRILKITLTSVAKCRWSWMWVWVNAVGKTKR